MLPVVTHPKTDRVVRCLTSVISYEHPVELRRVELRKVELRYERYEHYIVIIKYSVPENLWVPQQSRPETTETSPRRLSSQLPSHFAAHRAYSVRSDVIPSGTLGETSVGIRTGIRELGVWTVRVQCTSLKNHKGWANLLFRVHMASTASVYTTCRDSII